MGGCGVGENFRVRLRVGLDGPEGLVQPEGFCDSVSEMCGWTRLWLDRERDGRRGGTDGPVTGWTEWCRDELIRSTWMSGQDGGVGPGTVSGWLAS